MSDSLLDEALRFCKGAIDVMGDTPMRNTLRARHDVLERATWSLSLLPSVSVPPGVEVIRLARLVLELRDDVQHARTSSR